MSAAIDERAAWDLVRAVVPGSATDGSAARVGLGPRSEPWLEVSADGSWSTSGETSPGARTLLDIYVPVRVPPALVMGQLGQSLDGRIATEGGASHYVTGPEDIERLHRLRALVDAVIVGAGTVALDDPRLTVRLVEGPDPVRVVLAARPVDPGRRVFSEGTARTIVVRGSTAGRSPRAGEDAAYEELAVPTGEDGLDLQALLDALRARGLRRLLVEGGGRTVSGFLRAGLLDRLHLSVAPLLIGSGRPSITLDPVATLDQALRPRCRRFVLGEDVLFDLDLRRPPA